MSPLRAWLQLSFPSSFLVLIQSHRFVDVESTAHYHMQTLRAEVASNVMLLITVVFGCVLGVGGGVWERLHSARLMNSTSLEPVCCNNCAAGLHSERQRVRAELCLSPLQRLNLWKRVSGTGPLVSALTERTHTHARTHKENQNFKYIKINV